MCYMIEDESKYAKIWLFLDVVQWIVKIISNLYSDTTAKHNQPSSTS